MSKQNKKTGLIFLALVYVVFIILLFAWLLLDQGLPEWDMGRHLFTTLQYRDAWKGFELGQRNIVDMFGLYLYYPPLIYQYGLALFKVFGVSSKVAVAGNIVWILILFYSVSQIALRIYKNQLIAIASVLFVAASPLFIGQVREYQIDLPLAAMVALSFWLILRTEKFSKLWPSLLFGLVAGLSMLTKWSYIFYLLPLIALYFTFAIIESKDKIKVLLNFVYAVLVAIAVSGYWYLTNRQLLLTDFQQNGIKMAEIEGDPTGFNLPTLTWYLKRIPDTYLFLPLFVIYLAGLIWALAKKEWRKKLGLILILTPIYYLIFTMLPNKDVRYLLPLIPLLALTAVCAFNIDFGFCSPRFSVSGIDSNASKKSIANQTKVCSTINKKYGRYYQIVLLILLIAIFLINNLSIAFSQRLNWPKNNHYLFNNQYLPLISNHGYISGSPRAENCPIEPVMESIAEGKTVRLIGPDLIDYNNWMVAFYAGKEQKVWAGEVGDYLGSEYLIYRNQNINQPNVASELKSSGKIKLINTYDCADGGRVELYKTTEISNF